MVVVFAAALLGCGLAYFLAGRSHGAEMRLSASKSMQNNPDALLQKANHLSWVLNWPAAGQLYQRAEELFTTKGDTRDALYAKIGAMRSDAESMCSLISRKSLETNFPIPFWDNTHG